MMLIWVLRFQIFRKENLFTIQHISFCVSLESLVYTFIPTCSDKYLPLYRLVIVHGMVRPSFLLDSANLTLDKRASQMLFFIVYLFSTYVIAHP